MVLLIEQLNIQQETGLERGGVTHSKGPQGRTQTQGCCIKDKASVHGMPALPTKLNGTYDFLRCWHETTFLG